MKRNRHIALISWIFVLCLVGVVFSCKTADINLLGIKTFTFEHKHIGDSGKMIPVPQEKSNGVFTLDGAGKGVINGVLFSSDSNMVTYALVSFTIKDKDFTQEHWTNFYSDKKGRFIIRNLPEGPYKVATTQDNAYLTVCNDVIISAGNSQITLRLEIKPIE